jgi:hypothetical protein
MDFQTFLAKKRAKTLRTEELFDRDIMRVACGQHLNQTVANFELAGAQNLKTMAPHWYSLLDDNVLDRISQEALAAWKEAKRAVQPQTRHFLESGLTGRMIIVTSAPFLDERRFLLTLPHRRYLDFIRPYREIFHRVRDWEQREFVHWIFTAGPDESGYEEISVSLFYMESQKSLSSRMMSQMMRGERVDFEGQAMIVPTTYLPGNSGEDLFKELMKMDAIAKHGQ